MKELERGRRQTFLHFLQYQFVADFGGAQAWRHGVV